jgi:hypothetical protein
MYWNDWIASFFCNTFSFFNLFSEALNLVDCAADNGLNLDLIYVLTR